MPDRLASLADIEAAIWRELQQAVHGRGHPWRIAVLATVDGDAADARNVVLRDLDAAQRTLLMYTDARSPKARQVAAHSQGMLVLWSPALGWQLRLRVALSLETSGLRVSSRWAKLKLTPAAQDYLSPMAPGTALDESTPGTALNPSTPGTALDAPAPERQSREHFAVLAAQVQSVDWLELHAQGHRRALFSAAGAAWITP